MWPFCGRYVDTRAQDGYTALHLAVLFGALACVQALLDCGASVMVRTARDRQNEYATARGEITRTCLSAHRCCSVITAGCILALTARRPIVAALQGCGWPLPKPT